MTSVRNPALARFTVKLENNVTAFKKLTSEVATGQNLSKTVMEGIIGSKALESAKMSNAAIKQLGSGLNMVSSAIGTLSGIEQILQSMQLPLVGLELADGTALAAAQVNYINQVETIIRTLNTAEFGGISLFDGKLADPTNALPNEGIPQDASPWKLLASNNLEDIYRTNIPRLLAGDGSIVDVDAPGRFTPLFPWDPAALASVLAITNVVNLAIGGDPTSGAPIIDPSPAANAAAAATGQPVGSLANVQIGNNGKPINQGAANYIASRIEAVRPAGANIYINAIFETAKTVLALGPLNTHAELQQGVIKLAKAANTQSTPDSIAAINDITAKVTAAGPAFTTLENVCNTISAPAGAIPAIRAIYDVVRAAGASRFITKFPHLNEMHAGIIAAAKAATSANPGHAAGDVLTPASRDFVRGLLERAMNKTTALIADLGGVQRSLLNSAVSARVAYVQYNEVAHSNLDAEYSGLVSKMLQIMRENTTSNIAFNLSENRANMIFDLLSKAAKM